MLDERDLQAISRLMDEKLKPIREDLAELKEDHEETRAGVNSLLEWADNVSVARDFPLPKI